MPDTLTVLLLHQNPTNVMRYRLKTAIEREVADMSFSSNRESAADKLKNMVEHIEGGFGSSAARQYVIRMMAYCYLGKEPDFSSGEEALETVYWPMTKELIKQHKSSGEDRLYVSDVVDLDDLIPGKLNLIYAPCGSGKTYFIEHTVKSTFASPSQDVLYLAPTRALIEAHQFRGEMIECGNGWYEWKQAGITAMTYAAFGSRIRTAKDNGVYSDSSWWNSHSTICADELSQAYKQASYGGANAAENVTRYGLEELKKRVKNTSNLVITISATPKRFIDRYFFDTHIVRMELPPDGYETERVERYYDLETVLTKLSPLKRGLIYVHEISLMDKVVSALHSRNIHAVGIHSTHNENHKMDREQEATRRYLISNEALPENVKVLVINAAYETGLNIRPSATHLDYIVVHSTNEEVQTQVRGRYRGDIDTVYYHGSYEEYDKELDITVLPRFLCRPLYTADKKELCSLIDLKDERGRPKGWPSVKKFLESNGLVVESHNNRNSRWSVIRWADQEEDLM